MHLDLFWIFLGCIMYVYIYVFCSSQQVELFNLHLDISWIFFGCIIFFFIFVFSLSYCLSAIEI